MNRQIAQSIVALALLLLRPLPANAWGFGADNSCPRSTIDTVADFSKEILRPVAIASIEKDGSAFCNNEMAQRYLFSESMYSRLPKATYAEYKDAVATGSVNRLVNEKAAEESDTKNTNWIRSLIPTEEIRQSTTDQIPTGIAGQDAKVDLSGAVQFLQKSRCSFSRQLGNGSDAIVNGLTSPDEMGIKNSGVAKTYACSELMGVFGALTCSKSMDTVARIARPADSITGIEVYRRVLYDSRYDEGLRLAALRIASKVQSKQAPTSDYFSDLKESFEKSGASKSDAEEMAWNTTALLATAGPNTSFRLLAFKGEPEGSQKRIALHTIAACLPVLDHRSSAKGQVYSFPPGIKGACNTGKSYHFWFTAYLARRAALESGNAEAAAATAFQAEKLYHLKTRSSGADRSSASGLYTPASQIIRGDLSYAAVGAVYGANAAGDRHEGTINVDQNIAALIKTGGEGSAGAVASVAGFAGQDMAKTYATWMSKFDANSAFKAVQSSGFPKSVNSKYLDFEKTPKSDSCESDRRAH